ncbi:MAG: hypothetical protein EAS48_08110 [Chryseobacterium sp.]|nr:MAG: hypothetical protein EAS48_08110 [Chryseobacterium sp.]
MVNKRNLLKILAVKNDRYIATYLTRVLDNLENVGNQEQRYSIWAIVVVFLFVILENAQISSFSIASISFTDVDFIPKVLPVVYIYLVFNLKVMSAHKRDMQNTVNFLAGALYHQQETRNLIEEYRNSNAIHVLQPYGFLDTMTKRINQDPSKGKHFFQILFLLPAIVIPAVPYIAMVYMLIYVRMELYDDIIGVLGFWVTIAIFMFLLLYLTKEFLTERQRARDNHALAREMEKEEG